jgi:hypothetical protein
MIFINYIIVSSIPFASSSSSRDNPYKHIHTHTDIYQLQLAYIILINYRRVDESRIERNKKNQIKLKSLRLLNVCNLTTDKNGF